MVKKILNVRAQNQLLKKNFIVPFIKKKNLLRQAIEFIA